MQAILGNRVAPALLDRMMSKKAWDGQFSDAEIAADRADKMVSPVDGLHATHGAFDGRVKADSRQFWFERHRLMEAAGILIALGGLAFVAGLGAWIW